MFSEFFVTLYRIYRVPLKTRWTIHALVKLQYAELVNARLRPLPHEPTLYIRNKFTVIAVYVDHLLQSKLTLTVNNQCVVANFAPASAFLYLKFAEYQHIN